MTSSFSGWYYGWDRPLQRALVQRYADFLDAVRHCMTIHPVDLKGGALFDL